LQQARPSWLRGSSRQQIPLAGKAWGFMEKTSGLPRLRLPTLINYTALAVRTLLNIATSIIIARKLSVAEYGLWGITLSLVSSLSPFLTLLTWWAPRQAAWGRREASLTGLLLALSYGGFAALVFIVAGRSLGGPGSWLLLGSILALLTMVTTYLAALCSIEEPQASGVWSLIYEIVRLILVYLLLVVAHWGISGAIISMAGGFLAAIAYLARLAFSRGLIRPSINLGLAVKMLRYSYTQLPGLLARFLREWFRAYVKILTGSLEAVAMLNVGLAAEVPLLRISAAPAPALYARMLRRVEAWDVEETIRLYILFASYMVATLIALAKPIAALYNPAYVVAAPVIAVVSVYALLLGFFSIYSASIAGYERFDYDMEHPPGLIEVLFRPWSKPGLAALAAGILSYALYPLLLAERAGDPLWGALTAAEALLLGHVGFLIYIARLAHRLTGSRFPWRNALEALAASLVAVGLYVVLGAPWAVVGRFWVELEEVAVAAILGFIAYIAVFLGVSPWARGLAERALTLALERVGRRGTQV
jgi:O-antigen/teichoic acid export membrane protein